MFDEGVTRCKSMSDLLFFVRLDVMLVRDNKTTIFFCTYVIQISDFASKRRDRVVKMMYEFAERCKRVRVIYGVSWRGANERSLRIVRQKYPGECVWFGSATFRKLLISHVW